ACTGTNASPAPTMPTTTLMNGWEQHFAVDWAADQRPNGARRASGYVYNRKGENAEEEGLLVQAVDPSGAEIGGGVGLWPGGAGVYFEVPNLPAANSYRVSVWNYTLANSKSKR